MPDAGTSPETADVAVADMSADDIDALLSELDASVREADASEGRHAAGPSSPPRTAEPGGATTGASHEAVAAGPQSSLPDTDASPQNPSEAVAQLGSIVDGLDAEDDPQPTPDDHESPVAEAAGAPPPTEASAEDHPPEEAGSLPTLEVDAGQENTPAQIEARGEGDNAAPGTEVPSLDPEITETGPPPATQEATDVTPESAPAVQTAVRRCYGPRGLAGRIARGAVGAAVGGLVVLDAPFARMSTGTKAIIGYIGIGTLLVALGTWIGGSLLLPG